MKKTQKLNKKQLRSLIREAIETREPGSPLWSPPKALNEEVFDAIGDVERLVNGVANTLPYDENDPTMAHLGDEAWYRQLALMKDDLEQAIHDLIDEKVEALHGGEYHRG